MSERRYRLKQNYENELRMVGVDQKQLLGNYLGDMSQNVKSALLNSHKHQYQVAQGSRHIIALWNISIYTKYILTFIDAFLDGLDIA